MYRSETQIYKAQASSNNGKQSYTFQRINRDSNGNDTLVAIQNSGDDTYTVVQVVKDKEGKIKKRVYRMGADYIPSLLEANKEKLSNDLTKVVSLPKKRVTSRSTKTTQKKASTKNTKKKATKSKKAKSTKKRTIKKKKNSGFFFGLL